jgi:hypothetical protein
MGRGQAQAHRRLSCADCPHCLSGDIIQTLSIVEGVNVYQVWNSYSGNRSER